MLIGASGCNNRDSSTANTPSATSSPSVTSVRFNDRQIVSDFADQVVIPTQQLFAKKAEELSSAVNVFVKTPNDQTLKAAQDAWVAARSPWEQSECFTFGPAESLGYDAALDTWPVNETDLKAVFKSKDQFTPKYVAEKLKDTEKGFHVIEYLLFGENNNKTAADFNKRELDYLQALTMHFSQVANELVASWTKGVEGQPAYREVVVTAGESGNSTYPSLQAGAEEMVQGMIDSLDEVANEKIVRLSRKKIGSCSRADLAITPSMT
jgi:predicted lipoprotein